MAWLAQIFDGDMCTISRRAVLLEVPWFKLVAMATVAAGTPLY